MDVVLSGGVNAMSFDTKLLSLDATNDRIGIGTTAPIGKVNVVGDDDASVYQQLFKDVTSAAGSRVYKARGTAAAPRRVQSGDLIFVSNALAASAVDDSTNAVFGSAVGQFAFGASESHTPTAQGTFLRASTVKNGTTALTERWRTTDAGNVKIAGTALRGTTEGTNHLDIFDGTAPVGTLANGVSLYSTSGELRVMDAAGNATLLSPHEKDTNYWIYDSVDTVTGARLRIDVEQLLRKLNEMFGWNFVHDLNKEK